MLFLKAAYGSKQVGLSADKAGPSTVFDNYVKDAGENAVVKKMEDLGLKTIEYNGVKITLLDRENKNLESSHPDAIKKVLEKSDIILTDISTFQEKKLRSDMQLPGWADVMLEITQRGVVSDEIHKINTASPMQVGFDNAKSIVEKKVYGDSGLKQMRKEM